MSESSTLANMGDGVPRWCPDFTESSDIESHDCFEISPDIPSWLQIFSADFGKNEYNAMAKLRTAFTERNTQVSVPGPFFHGSLSWKYWLK